MPPAVLGLDDAQEQLHRETRSDEADHAICAHDLPALQHPDDVIEIRDHVRHTEARADP
jgi:hypothetical protein